MSQISVRALNISGRVRAAILRRCALSLEIHPPKQDESKISAHNAGLGPAALVSGIKRSWVIDWLTPRCKRVPSSWVPARRWHCSVRRHLRQNL